MKVLLIFVASLFSMCVFGQAAPSDTPPKNWHLLDWQEDGIRGIGSEKAYRILLKDKKPAAQVIVAIIDTGVDDEHPELKGVIWENRKEIPGNGKDDDKNGYPDDRHGWNFVGNTQHGTFEVIREYIRLRKSFEPETDSTLQAKKPGYGYWKRVRDGKDKFYNENRSYISLLQARGNEYRLLINYYKSKFGVDSVYHQTLLKSPIPAGEDSLLMDSYKHGIEAFSVQEFEGMSLNERLLLLENYIAMLAEPLAVADTMIARNDVAYYSAREGITAPDIDNGKSYGNNVIMPKDDHGTACAGIVAAVRHNGQGMDGVADHVSIMPIRIFIDAQVDEIDKDVANAIRYAVDNGARIINMSFGKYFSPQKAQVDKAVAYAEQKGVLIICAAGNEANNVDSLTMYPSAVYLDKRTALNVIKVGASSHDSTLVADYSNYGKNSVDVFAPGSDIYSLAKGNDYLVESGTSFAAPMVTGIAAMLLSHYPNLSYKQIKSCIEHSAFPIGTMVKRPGSDEMVPFNSLSRTGGIVNAYEAIREAQKISTR